MATKAQILVLAGASVVAGVTTAATAVLPFDEAAATRLATGLGVAGVVLGGAMTMLRGRVPQWLLHPILLIATAGVSTSIASSAIAAGPAVTALRYFWIALYAALFLSRRAVVAHGLAIAVGLAWGLHASGAPWGPQTWGFVVMTLAAAAGTVHVLIERLRHLAHRDPLTALVTRSAFIAMAEQAMYLSSRSGMPLTLALIDLDGFKILNDERGHAHGDSVLVALADAWRGVVRRGDVLGRHGGDEFILLMPGTTVENSAAVIRRLREARPETSWTAGVAEWGGESLTDWINRADLDLYANKRARTLLTTELTVPEPAARSVGSGH